MWVFFTDVWGPDPVKVQSPGEHGLICDESHGWFKYKIKNVLRFQTEKKKASETREEERSFVILTGRLRFFFFFLFLSPPQSFVLFLLEKCNSLLCGVKLHPVWSRILVVFVGVNEV